MDNPEKTGGSIKNGQSRETGNTGNTRHKTKTNKTIHRKLKRGATLAQPNRVLNPCASKGQSVPVSYKPDAMLLI